MIHFNVGNTGFKGPNQGHHPLIQSLICTLDGAVTTPLITLGGIPFMLNLWKKVKTFEKQNEE
jgi:hypothetical protein